MLVTEEGRERGCDGPERRVRVRDQLEALEEQRRERMAMRIASMPKGLKFVFLRFDARVWV
eukprot:1440079-Rhodomonas_salina.1